MRHPYKGIAQCVALRPRSNFHGQLALGDGRRNGGHLFQVRHHIVERSGQRANFVVARKVTIVLMVVQRAAESEDSWSALLISPLIWSSTPADGFSQALGSFCR